MHWKKSQSYADYRKLRETILETSPQDYKKACLMVQDKQMQALNAFAQKQFISQKALQIKKLDIEFSALEQILSYDMYREGAQSNKVSKDTQQENKPTQDYKLDNILL